MRRQFMLILAVGLATGSQGVAAAAPSRAPAAAPAPARARPEALEPVTRTAFLASLDSSFKAADTNRDGVLSQSEIAAAEAKVIQQRLAAVRAQLETEFAKLDTNHDGQLSMTEFMAAAPQAPATPPNGAEAMAALDKNHDGKISLEEFRAPRLAAFDRLDTNHDGTISPAERAAAATPRQR